MTRFGKLSICAAALLSAAIFTASCDKKVAAKENLSGGTGPFPAKVEPDLDAGHFKVDHPERFPMVTAIGRAATPQLEVTGSVSPDVSRQTPVPSLATGRVVEINARLGDTVQKGQLLFKVRSTDIAGAYADYRKAVKNDELAKLQLNRAKLLFDDGAIPKSALEIAQTTQENSAVDVETAVERLRLLGADPDHPSGIVEVSAPVTGIITDQQITLASGVQALTAPNPFTISDVSHVWILCDVYENDIAQVHLGEFAEIRLAAFPGRVLQGRIGNIAPAVDPNIRTEKVRLEVENPGYMRLGMFVTATFHGETAEMRATVPSSAILHLHDREWVYTPDGKGAFRRVEVVAGGMLPDNMQEIVSGVKPGDSVVADALRFQNTVEQ
jgi:cobalt-zinc-cadmium efflux system membrane fusion protein